MCSRIGRHELERGADSDPAHQRKTAIRNGLRGERFVPHFRGVFSLNICNVKDTPSRSTAFTPHVRADQSSKLGLSMRASHPGSILNQITPASRNPQAYPG